MKLKIVHLVLALALIFVVGSAFSMPPPGHDEDRGKGHVQHEIAGGNGNGHHKHDVSSS